MSEAISVFLTAHPEVVTAIVGALIVHLRAVVPTGKPGTFWGVVTSVWDGLAGNWGYAANTPVQDKQDETKLKDALDD